MNFVIVPTETAPTNGAIVPGSLRHYAIQRNQPLALAWVRVQAVIIFDRSASIDEADAPGGRTRYALACDELAALQAQMPGRLAIVQFNDGVNLVAGGQPDSPRGLTDLAGALAYVKQKRMDTPGMRIIVISDGEPNSESDALAMAGAINNRIDVIYCGPAHLPEGRDFLRRLAVASGGQLTTADRVDGLQKAVVGLLGVAA